MIALEIVVLGALVFGFACAISRAERRDLAAALFLGGVGCGLLMGHILCQDAADRLSWRLRGQLEPAVELRADRP